MNRALPFSRITRSTTKSKGVVLLALACSLTLSACASPVAPSAEPANFYEAVRSDAEKFWADYFSSKLGRTYTQITEMELFTEQASSRCTGDSVAFYCRLDRGVYLSSGFMQSELSKFGKFGSAVIIGHEIGHHVQNLLGLTGGLTIERELQADCVAGAWMKGADVRGLLEVGDYEEAANGVFAAGDGLPWRHPAAHGTPEERREAFRIGFRYGVSSCSWQ